MGSAQPESEARSGEGAHDDYALDALRYCLLGMGIEPKDSPPFSLSRAFAERHNRFFKPPASRQFRKFFEDRAKRMEKEKQKHLQYLWLEELSQFEPTFDPKRVVYGIDYGKVEIR